MHRLQELILARLRYIWYIHLLQDPLHEYLLMVQQVTLDHHRMTRQQKV